MSPHLGSSGRAAEDLIEKHLKKNGYLVIARNHVISNIGELDIVAMKDGVLCFVEVRSRSNDRLGYPSETVGPRKQQKIRRLASLFMASRKSDLPARFDVASVIWNAGQPDIDYIEDAFE